MLAVIVVAVLLFTGGGSSYEINADARQREPAREGQPGEGRRRVRSARSNSIDLADDGRARVKLTIDDARRHAAAHRLARRGALVVAVGRGEPLRRAHARPRQRRRDRRRRRHPRRGHERRGRPRRAPEHARPDDAARPQGARARRRRRASRDAAKQLGARDRGARPGAVPDHGDRAGDPPRRGHVHALPGRVGRRGRRRSASRPERLERLVAHGARDDGRAGRRATRASTRSCAARPTRCARRTPRS